MGTRLHNRLHNVYLRKKLLRMHATVTVFTCSLILLRGVLLAANILHVQWPYVDRAARFLVYILELLWTTVILFCYALMPLYSDLKVKLWRLHNGAEIAKGMPLLLHVCNVTHCFFFNNSVQSFNAPETWIQGRQRDVSIP